MQTKNSLNFAKQLYKKYSPSNPKTYTTGVGTSGSGKASRFVKVPFCSAETCKPPGPVYPVMIFEHGSVWFLMKGFILLRQQYKPSIMGISDP